MKSEKGVYYVVLNYFVMKVDNIILEGFGFVMYVVKFNDLVIVVSYYWYFDI